MLPCLEWCHPFKRLAAFGAVTTPNSQHHLRPVFCGIRSVANVFVPLSLVSYDQHFSSFPRRVLLHCNTKMRHSRWGATSRKATSSRHRLLRMAHFCAIAFLLVLPNGMAQLLLHYCAIVFLNGAELPVNYRSTPAILLGRFAAPRRTPFRDFRCTGSV